MAKVLVTGGTGFIAAHIIVQLLERGYHVVTTVRSDDKGRAVLNVHNSTGVKDRLSYKIVKDVAQPGAYDEAVRSIANLDFVIHTTSPVVFSVEDPVRDMLEPAVNGTTNILKAVKAYAPSVKRVVLLSSYAAMRDDDRKPPPVYDESWWNPITWEEAVQNPKKTYQGSKALSERAAWDFMRDENPSFELVAINPSRVFGPAAPHLIKGELDKVNTTNMVILDMVQGKMKDKLEPTGFYSWVGVRDVALAHVRALEMPEAAGKRFFLIAGYHSNKEIVEIIKSMSHELAVRLPADLDKFEVDIPGPGERYGFDNKQSREVLGIEYASLQTTIKETVDSFVKLGA